MPARYVRYIPAEYDAEGVRTTQPQSVYRVSCTGCSEAVEQIGTGRTEDTEALFRWHASGRYVSRCRACERRARRNAPARARVAGSRRVRTTRVALVSNDARRFGIELECVFPAGVDRYRVGNALYDAGLHDWSVKTDCSIRGNGFEVVSPPISGEEGRRQLRVACAALTALGATVDRSCGTHVHHEVRDLSADALRRVARTWANNQGVIDGLVSASRRGRPTYCVGFDSSDADYVERAENPRRVGLTRYKALNFASLGRYGTLEVRQHQGTLSAAKIEAWLEFAQSLFAAAAEADVALAPAPSVRTLLASLPALSEDAAAFLLGRAIQLSPSGVS